jgi:hypothetical protein
MDEDYIIVETYTVECIYSLIDAFCNFMSMEGLALGKTATEIYLQGLQVDS